MNIQSVVKILLISFNLGNDVDPNNRNMEIKQSVDVDFIKTIKANKTSNASFVKSMKSNAISAGHSISGENRSSELFKRVRNSASSSEANPSSISHLKHLSKIHEVRRGTHIKKNESNNFQGFLGRLTETTSNFDKTDNHLVSKKSPLFQKIKDLSKRFQHK